MYSNFQLYPTRPLQPAAGQYSNPLPFFTPAFIESPSSQQTSIVYESSMMVSQMTGYSDSQLFSSFDGTFGMDDYLSTMDGSCLDPMQQLLTPNTIPLSPLTSSSSSSSPMLDGFASMDLLPSTSSSSPSPSYDPYSYLVAPTQGSIQTPTDFKKPTPSKGDFRCKFTGCTMVFGRKYNLTSHEVTHNAIRKYACDYCTKAFVRRHDWKRHVRIHTGETPHKCRYCDKGFGRADGLQRHYTLNNTECSRKLMNDPSNSFRHKKRNRKTGFGAKSSL